MFSDLQLDGPDSLHLCPKQFCWSGKSVLTSSYKTKTQKTLHHIAEYVIMLIIYNSCINWLNTDNIKLWYYCFCCSRRIWLKLSVVFRLLFLKQKLLSYRPSKQKRQNFDSKHQKHPPCPNLLKLARIKITTLIVLQVELPKVETKSIPSRRWTPNFPCGRPGGDAPLWPPATPPYTPLYPKADCGKLHRYFANLFRQSTRSHLGWRSDNRND